MREKEWAVYQGDDFLFTGTTSECAERLGRTKESFRFIGSPAYKRRMKEDGNALFIVDITDAAREAGIK